MPFYGLPPCGPSNSSKIIRSDPVTFLQTGRPRKSFTFNTCELSRKCGKQRTYRKSKSFRCNTYKKHRGEGVLWLPRHPLRGVCPEPPSGEKDLSLTLQPLNHPACKRPLIHTIHRDPAHQLG